MNHNTNDHISGSGFYLDPTRFTAPSATFRIKNQLTSNGYDNSGRVEGSDDKEHGILSGFARFASPEAKTGFVSAAANGGLDENVCGFGSGFAHFGAPATLTWFGTNAAFTSDLAHSGRVAKFGENQRGGGRLRIRGEDEDNDVQMWKRKKLVMKNSRASFGSFSSGSGFGSSYNPQVPPALAPPHVAPPPHARVNDETGLVFLFEKELQKSDLSRHHRIVIPKKAAESHLPVLVNGTGLTLIINDTEGVSWKFRFRYWVNNKARMYLLENTGDFVRRHGLQIGDSIFLYRQRLGHKYIIESRKRKYTSSPTDAIHSQAAAPVAIETGGNEGHVYTGHTEADAEDHQLIYDLKFYNPNLGELSLSLNHGQRPSHSFQYGSNQ